MIARRAVRLAAIALSLTTSGCAVGNFIAGAPPRQPASPGSALLARRCGSCHVVPEPAAMNAEAWQAALGRMKLRMRLPASEWDSLAAMRPRDARP